MVLALELQLILNDPSPHHWDSGDFTITNPLMEKMMTAALESPLKREVLNHDRQARTTELLQKNLVNMIDLALLLKQAHWNVLGQNFRSIHLQLDEIIASVRAASDEIAERITTLGIAADGRSSTVARESDLESYSRDFQNVSATVSAVANALKQTIDGLRGCDRTARRPRSDQRGLVHRHLGKSGKASLDGASPRGLKIRGPRSLVRRSDSASLADLDYSCGG